MNVNDIAALLAANLNDEANRLVLADALTDAGRDAEATLTRNGQGIFGVSGGKLVRLDQLLHRNPGSRRGRLAYARQLQLAGQHSHGERQAAMASYAGCLEKLTPAMTSELATSYFMTSSTAWPTVEVVVEWCPTLLVFTYHCREGNDLDHGNPRLPCAGAGQHARYLLASNWQTLEYEMLTHDAGLDFESLASSLEIACVHTVDCE